MSQDRKALTDAEVTTMINKTLEAKEFSYSPYSHFRVGASVLFHDGSIVTGCNVENVSYGLCICAERTAYTKAISDGKNDFRAVFVCTDAKDQFVWPCGACRQFMSEFGDIDVYSVTNEKKFEKTTLNELLPKGFDSVALEKGQK